MRSLLGHAHAVDGGAAFVDARGAMWLPGSTAGPGPLRRRAELAALREELATTELARRAAADAADIARVDLDHRDTEATAAAEGEAEARLALRRSDEHRGEVARRLERVDRELAEAVALSMARQDAHAY